MKIFISADIEGITGVSNWEETSNNNSSAKYFIDQMTREVSAACFGANEGGATEIIVKDAHGSGRNINPSSLPTNVKVIRDWSMGPLSMMEGIDSSFDFVMFVGYHSGANMDGNPLAHTFSNSKFQYIKLNGEYVSEYDLNSLVAAYYKVPVVFLTGDKELCNRAKKKNPNIVTVCVMESIGNATLSIHPEVARNLINDSAKKAVSENLGSHLTELPKSFEFEIMFKEAKNAFRSSFYPGVVKKDPKTVEFVTNDYYEFLRMFMFI